MRASQFLIKPVSESCNIDCKYCFYKDIASRRNIRNYGHMSFSTLEAIVRRAYEETEEEVTFAFQGGEPLLRGIDFFYHFFFTRRAVQRPKYSDAVFRSNERDVN